MLKKIFFFLVFLSTVYFRNISSANQLSGKNALDVMVFNTNKIPVYFDYEIALLLDFKNASENILEEVELAHALQQGHATHIP